MGYPFPSKQEEAPANQLAYEIVREATGEAPPEPEQPDTRNPSAVELSKLGAANDPEAEKRYSPATCIGLKVEEVTGNPDPKHISTSYVERQALGNR